VRALAVLALCLAYNIASAQNDNPPVITSADAISLEEGFRKTSLFFTVTDADGTSSITYTITGGADRNLFRIDLSDLKGRPRLAFSFLPSFEDAKDANKDNKYEVEVTANDGKNNSDPQAITVTVTDVNEVPVITDASLKDFSVLANATIGTSVGTPIVATDEDAGQMLSYPITFLNGGDGDFEVDNTTGQIKVKQLLTKSPGERYQFIIKAMDNGTPPLSSVNVVFFISVLEPNTAPSFTMAATTAVTLNEDATGDVRQFTAIPNDDGQTVTYSLTGTNADDFSINMNNGQITVGDGGLDFETTRSYTLTVVATDNGSLRLTDTRTFSITINDVNEHDPVIGTIPNNLTITDDAVAGARVGSPISAMDADTEQTLTYSLAGTNATDFMIDDNGQISVSNTADLDASSKGSYSLNVTVTDDVEVTRSVTEAITIVVTSPPVANQAPTVANAITNRTETEEFDPITINLEAVANVVFADADNDDLTYTAVSGTTGVVTVDVDDSNLTITYGGATGTSIITVTANDGRTGGTVNNVFNVMVNANMAPTFNEGNAVGREVAEDATEGTNVGNPVTATDNEKNPIVYAIKVSDSNFDIDSSTGQITVKSTASLDRESTAMYMLTVPLWIPKVQIHQLRALSPLRLRM